MPEAPKPPLAPHLPPGGLTAGPFNLHADAIHLDHGVGATPIQAFNNGYEAYVAEYCLPDAPGRLLSVATSAVDWPVWEVHPAGDEVVVLLSGRARFIQDFSGELRTCELGPGEAVINPAGVPHTAEVIEPFTALYLTPCPGTEHRPR